MQINIRVIPKAKRNEVVESRWGMPVSGMPAGLGQPSPTNPPLKIYTTTAPADGKANESVIKLLSEHFGIAKSRVKIIR